MPGTSGFRGGCIVREPLPAPYPSGLLYSRACSPNFRGDPFMHSLQRLTQRLVVIGLLAAACLLFARAQYAAEQENRAMAVRDLARIIDRAVLERLQSEKIEPSPLAGDAEFMRR